MWRDAHLLAKEVYRASAGFPPEERFGLTQQIRRASVSIAANIAEGSGRRTTADFRRFVDISAGSASEVEYYVLLTGDLKWLTPEDRDLLRKKVREIRRQLVGLRKALT